MVLRQEVFGYMHDGDELVEGPFRRLIAERKLMASRMRAIGRAWTHLKKSKTSKICSAEERHRGPCGMVTIEKRTSRSRIILPIAQLRQTRRFGARVASASMARSAVGVEPKYP